MRRGSVGEVRSRRDAPLRDQDAFGNREAIHGIEGFVPAVERKDLADGGGADGAACIEAENALPGLPGMAERALKTGGFLDEGIERESDGLRSPADLGY